MRPRQPWQIFMRRVSVALALLASVLVLPGCGVMMKPDRLWSPDGKAIAYAQDASIGLYDPASKQSRILPSGFDGVLFPCWSPDGKQIAFFAASEPKEGSIDRISLCTIDVASGQVATLVDDVWRVPREAVEKTRAAGESYEEASSRIRVDLPLLVLLFPGLAWSPDGGRIAYVAFQYDSIVIFLFDRASGTRIPVSRKRGGQWAAAWSPDGRWLAYAQAPFERSDPGEPAGVGEPDSIWLYDSASGTASKLCSLAGTNLVRPRFQWSPDSRQIGFIGSASDGNAAGYIVDAQPGAVPKRAITGISTDAVWSPALNGIAYAQQGKQVGSPVAILLRRPSGRMPKRLALLKPHNVTAGESETPETTSGDLSFALDFSPDSRQVAVADFTESAKVQVSIFPVE